LLELQSAVDKDARANFLGSPTVPTNAPLSLIPLSRTPTSTLELMQRVPPRVLVTSAVDAYYRSVAWYVHVITRSAYQRHEDAVFEAKDANKAAPPFSLAVCFALWALGLFASDTTEPAYAKYSKTDLAVALVELARNALAIGRFLQEPSLDAVRALLLISTHYAVLAPGEDGGSGIGLLALAVQGCLQVRLLHLPLLACSRFSSSLPLLLVLTDRLTCSSSSIAIPTSVVPTSHSPRRRTAVVCSGFVF
jgi:hypothetical protein